MAEHRNIGLTEHNSAGSAHACDHRRVGRRHQIYPACLAIKQRPAGGGRETYHVHRIFNHDRHAGQRSEFLAGGTASVNGPSIVKRRGVQENDGIVFWVVGCDPIQASLGQGFCGERTAFEAGLDLFDGKLDQVQTGSAGRFRIFRRRSLAHQNIPLCRSPNSLALGVRRCVAKCDFWQVLLGYQR